MKKLLGSLSLLMLSSILFSSAPHYEFRPYLSKDPRNHLRVGMDGGIKYFYLNDWLGPHGSSNRSDPHFIAYILEFNGDLKTGLFTVAYALSNRAVPTSAPRTVTFWYTIAGRTYERTYNLISRFGEEYSLILEGQGQLAYELNEMASAERIVHQISGDSPMEFSQDDKNYFRSLTSAYSQYFNAFPSQRPNRPNPGFGDGNNPSPVPPAVPKDQGGQSGGNGESFEFNFNLKKN